MRNWWSGIILALGASVPDSISGFRPLFGHRMCRRRFSIDNWRDQQALDLRVYGVTDPACNAKYSRTNIEAVTAAIEGGVTIVQLREKEADGAAFCKEAESVLHIAKPKGVCFACLECSQTQGNANAAIALVFMLKAAQFKGLTQAARPCGQHSFHLQLVQLVCLFQHLTTLWLAERFMRIGNLFCL